MKKRCRDHRPIIVHECGGRDVGKNEYYMQGSATQQVMYNAKYVEVTKMADNVMSSTRCNYNKRGPEC